MITLQDAVENFLRQAWFKQREDERRRKEAVVSQTIACVDKVRIPCGVQAQAVPYGLICTHWCDTVELSQKLDLPLHLLFPDVLSYREVKEVHVNELAQRLREDVQLRWQVLNACSRHSPHCEQGQAWLSTYVHATRWRPLHQKLLSKWRDTLAEGGGGAHGQGVAETMFVNFAALLPTDKWPHVYAWCIAFLVYSADTGTFIPGHAGGALGGEELTEWLLHYYDPEWSFDEAVGLKNLSTAWRRRVASKADVLPPPTTCPSYDAFAAAIAARLPPLPPPATDSREEQTGHALLCTTRQSALYPPMFCDPDTLTFI